ncbi:peptidoglycan bridge formation glycyltransferase FemA/FemB family protein [Schaalia sp. ZJ1691]|uniref:lipid II:glycine glycyltransferase FemX n=1 Tax=Schaalia sp. ZJ1691 TaxID=2709404 RepID=UPI0013EA618C|nr:peptidoglycan bridge formation glycyltransferase FemA/FemB family protein [Schaalia sp. ZJ1691]
MTQDHDRAQVTDDFLGRQHFLQSEQWEHFQRARGVETLRASGDGWSYLGLIESSRMNKRLYLPYGPTYSSVDAFRAAIDDASKQAKEHHLDYIRVEPRHDVSAQLLESMGFVRSHKDIQPPCTVMNDVRPVLVNEDNEAQVPSNGNDDLMAGAKSMVRRLVRKCERAGVEYRQSFEVEDVEHFLETIHDVSDRTGMHPHDDDYYRDMARALFPSHAAGMFLAELDGKPIASIIFFSDGHVMSYAHAGNLSEYRKISPSNGLAMYALRAARTSGHEIFDFFGAAPEDAPEDHPWQGFTRFKLGFGGERVSTVGTWELPIKRVKYALYRQALKVVESRTGRAAGGTQ